MAKYSFENAIDVCNDDTGEVIRVCHDRDGLDLVEIQSRTSPNEIAQHVILTVEQAEMLIVALQQHLLARSMKFNAKRSCPNCDYTE